MVEFCSTMRLHVKWTTDEDKPAHLECMWQILLFKVLHSNGVHLGKMHKIYAKKFYWFVLAYTQNTATLVHSSFILWHFILQMQSVYFKEVCPTLKTIQTTIPHSAGALYLISFFNPTPNSSLEHTNYKYNNINPGFAEVHYHCKT